MSLAATADKNGEVASQKAIERRLKSVNYDHSQPTKVGQDIRKVWYRNKHFCNKKIWFRAASDAATFSKRVNGKKLS